MKKSYIIYVLIALFAISIMNVTQVKAAVSFTGNSVIKPLIDDGSHDYVHWYGETKTSASVIDIYVSSTLYVNGQLYNLGSDDEKNSMYAIVSTREYSLYNQIGAYLQLRSWHTIDDNGLPNQMWTYDDMTIY